MEKIILTGVPETMLQTVFVEIIAPIYGVIGKIPFVRNLSNRIVVLAGEGTAKW